MSRADRAKQFLPFDALQGLRDALREKEIEHEKEVEKSQGHEPDLESQEHIEN